MCRSICRTCLEESENLMSVFENLYEDNKLKISNIISLITNSEIDINDGLPITICQDCLTETKRIHGFQQLCLQSEKILKENINQNASADVLENSEPLYVEIQPLNIKTDIENEENTLVENISGINNIDNEQLFNHIEPLNIEQNIEEQIIKEIEIEIIDKVPKVEIDEDNKFLPKINNKDKKFPCDICSFVCANRMTYKLHRERHSQLPNYLCNFCGQTFVSQPQYNIHLRSHDPDNKLRCNICGRIAANPANLRKHFLVHTKEKPFKCDICDTPFSQKSSLNVHMRLHTGEQPYKCNICQKSFTTSSSFLKHKRRHANEKPNKCTLCPKAFVSSSELKTHMYTHGVYEKPHKCETCGKKFVTARDLKYHSYTHTGNKPYVCGICNRGFIQKFLLNGHLKRVHDVIQVNEN